MMLGIFHSRQQPLQRSQTDRMYWSTCEKLLHVLSPRLLSICVLVTDNWTRQLPVVCLADSPVSQSWEMHTHTHIQHDAGVRTVQHCPSSKHHIFKTLIPALHAQASTPVQNKLNHQQSLYSTSSKSLYSTSSNVFQFLGYTVCS